MKGSGFNPGLQHSKGYYGFFENRWVHITGRELYSLQEVNVRVNM